MIGARLRARAEELAARGEAFVTATVVRVQRPTSVQPGNVAIVHEDGTIEGFVGGVCAQHSIRRYALRAIETGEPVLLRILPDGPPTDEPTAGVQVDHQEGAVTVQNPCLSGGAIEVFLEPVLPAPRVLVAGESPIAVALARLGPELGFDVVTAQDADPRDATPRPDDLGLVIAAHGRGELELLRAGLQAGVEYIGLVASPKRGATVLEELRRAGVSDELLDAIDTPAGFNIGARTPAEVALSILAQIISVRRRGGAPAPSNAGAPKSPLTATDPVCGMTVVVGLDTPATVNDGDTVYFCCDGCRRAFESQHA